MSVWVIAEWDVQDGQPVLRGATRHAVTAASGLGQKVTMLVIGHQCQAVAQQASMIKGLDHVVLVDQADFADQLPETLALAVRELAVSASHIVLPATAFGKNLMPRIAVLLDCQPISDVVAIHAPDTFTRPIYAGNALAMVQSRDHIKVMTIRGTAFDAAPDTVACPVETVSLSIPHHRMARFAGRELTISARPELTAARVIVSGGRGLGSRENFSILEPLADKLGAAIGASRAAVDAGFVPNDYQVGQTGKVVAPDLYIAIGISGAIQHLAGMKDSRVIVAINKDADAPIFQIADYGLVADLFDVIPDLTNAL